MKSIDKNIVLLGVVSYFTDFASAMKPLVVGGYILSSIGKPLFGFHKTLDLAGELNAALFLFVMLSDIYLTPYD